MKLWNIFFVIPWLPLLYTCWEKVWGLSLVPYLPISCREQFQYITHSSHSSIHHTIQTLFQRFNRTSHSPVKHQFITHSRPCSSDSSVHHTLWPFIHSSHSRPCSSDSTVHHTLRPFIHSLHTSDPAPAIHPFITHSSHKSLHHKLYSYLSIHHIHITFSSHSSVINKFQP